MNKSEFFGVIFLASSLASLPAQVPNSASPPPNYVQSSKLVGMKVKDSHGESVGTIKDVVIDRETGCMAYTVISTGDSGTRLTGTTKTVAVPWKVYGESADPNTMALTVDRERVYAAPAFEYSRIGEYSTSSYIDRIYSYYGVQPSLTTSTDTNVTSNPTVQPALQSQTEATASPTPTAAPSSAPSVTPTATATSNPTATPTPSPTSTETPSPTPTPTSSPSATAKPRSSWAAAATRPSATPSASAKERKTSAEPPGEGPNSPAKKIGRYRPTPTPSPTPKKTTW